MKAAAEFCFRVPTFTRMLLERLRIPARQGIAGIAFQQFGVGGKTGISVENRAVKNQLSFCAVDKNF
jgi:hypothetical protein